MTNHAPPPPMHVVVGITPDETGENALAHAVDMARRADVWLHLCYAAGDASDDADAAAEKLSEGEARLATWAASRVFGDPLIARTKIYVDLGEPADVLRRLAADVKASLIVVGSHGKGVLSQLLEGSVVADLMKQSPCPVTVATPIDHASVEPSPQVEAGHAPGDAKRTLGRPHQYRYRRTIALGTDQSTVGPGTA